MMEILSLFSVVIFSVTHRVLCVDTCEPTTCGPTGPVVRFPFRLDRQPGRCGYPGFDLSCNNRSQVVLNLPYVGDIVVNDIDYLSQTIYLKPDFCLLNRTQYFYTSGSGTPFSFGTFVEYSFFNCSRLPIFPVFESLVEVLDCISSVNNTVVAVPTGIVNGFSDQGSSEFCQLVTADLVPVGFVWDPRLCGRCERENGTCGYKNVETLEVGCSISSKSG